LKTGHVDLLAEHLELLDGGGAVDVGGDEQRLLALLLEQRASLPVVVVLPEPCRPTIMMPVGPRLLRCAGCSTGSSGDELVVADLDEVLGRPET
jgi:hypothetical protein